MEQNVKDIPNVPGKSRFRFWLLFLFIFFLFATGGFTLIYITHPQQTDDSNQDNPLQRIADDIRSFVDPKAVFLKDRINVLCLGLDENWTERDIMYTKNSRSDTILVASLSLTDKTIKVLSIPRDSYVEIPGYGHDKINSAHAIGGVPLAKSTVKSFLGVPIDYTVLLKVEATKHVIDAIGGVDITVEKQMDYDDNWGHLHIHLKPGYQRLFGEEALGFSRFRHDELGDFGRMGRQQQLLKGVAKRMQDPLVWGKLGEVIKIVKQNVTTDLATPQLIALANLYHDIDPSTIKTSTLEGDATMIGGMSVVIQKDEIKAEKLKEFLLPQSQQEQSGIRVEVLNGTGIPSLAAYAADKLRSRGYLVVKIDNADFSNYEETIVIDRRGEPALSQDIVGVIGKGKITVEHSTSIEKSDLTVIIGKDYENKQ